MSETVGFPDFVRAHSRSLFGTALLLTGSRDGAEELVQDTLAHLYPQWSRVSSAESPLAYVRRAVTNRFVSGRRRPSSYELAVWDLPDGVAPGDFVTGLADRGQLFQLLGTLPERQRAALVLRYFHDLPDDEIAATLGCRAVTVRSLVSRGIAAMRESAADHAASGTRGEL